MILVLKNADFSQNAIGTIVDYSYTKELLSEHFSSHATDTDAEALQVFLNSIGLGTENSIYDRLRWLLIPMFGNSVNEDAFDIKNNVQGAIEHPTSFSHLSRGIVLSNVGATPSGVQNLPSADNDLGSIFCVKTDSTKRSSYLCNGGKGGYLKHNGAPVTSGIFSESVGGESVSSLYVPTGTRVLMVYELGNQINDVIKIKSESASASYYLLQNDVIGDYNKKISRLCSHFTTDTATYCNIDDPVMMIGSVKNMTDNDANVLTSAIMTLLSDLNL